MSAAPLMYLVMINELVFTCFSGMGEENVGGLVFLELCSLSFVLVQVVL